MTIDLSTTTRQYLLIDECAELFVVSRRTIYNWLNAGVLTSIKIRGSRRITVESARQVASKLQKEPSEPARRVYLVQPHETTH